MRLKSGAKIQLFALLASFSLAQCGRAKYHAASAGAGPVDTATSVAGPWIEGGLESGAPQFRPVPTPSSLAAAPESPTHDAGDQVLYDPSKDTEDPSVKALVGRDRLAPREERRLLDRIFRSHYLTDISQCPLESGDLSRARRSDNFVPAVVQVATGAFTKADTVQTLYLVMDGECGAGHVDNMGSMTLAVFDGPDFVARALISGGSSIARVIDIDGDGRNEILLTYTFTNMGEMDTWAKIARMDLGRLVVIKDFGQVSSAQCWGGLGPATERYTVLSLARNADGSPRFPVERKSTACH